MGWRLIVERKRVVRWRMKERIMEGRGKRHTARPGIRHRRVVVNEKGGCWTGAVTDVDGAHCGRHYCERSQSQGDSNSG